jgi:hypothetical protein
MGDKAFQSLFGKQENSDLLISLLNGLLDLDDQIIEVTIQSRIFYDSFSQNRQLYRCYMFI